MALLSLSFVFFMLAGFLNAQFSDPPSASYTGALPIYTNGNQFKASWSSTFDEVDLVLWNDYHDSTGNEAIYRLLNHQSPDPGEWSGPLSVNLSQGSSFHLVLYSVDSTGKEGDFLNSASFEVIPGDDDSSGAAASTVTETDVYTMTAAASTETDYKTRTVTGNNFVATPGGSGSSESSTFATVGVPTDVANAIAAASSSAIAVAEASNSGNLPHDAVLGLGIGLGLGVPLLVAATVAATLYFCASSAASAKGSQHGGQFGTMSQRTAY